MNRIHIIGRKNHGKTRLIEELIRELTRRGLRVGTIKHTRYRYELDVSEKDSIRHRAAGAEAACVVSNAVSAVLLPADGPQSHEERYAVIASAFVDCDIVLAEGDPETAAPKIEVWRAVKGYFPLAKTDRSILAVVTDDVVNFETLVLPRADVAGLATWLLTRAADAGPGNGAADRLPLPGPASGKKRKRS